MAAKKRKQACSREAPSKAALVHNEKMKKAGNSLLRVIPAFSLLNGYLVSVGRMPFMSLMP